MSDSARDIDLVQMIADLRAEVARINLERASNPGVPTGLVLPCPLRTLPNGFLWADGTAVSRTTYQALFESVVPLLGSCTVTIASPGVFTLTGHGLSIGDAVYLTTTGALPTGLAANTIYYVMTVPTSSTFTLGASRSTTAVTSAKNTSGSQSGTHSLYYCPWGLGNGSSTFNVPDYRGVTLVGADAVPGGSDRGLLTWLNTIGVQGGEQDHTLTSAEMPSHTHTQNSHNHTQDAHTHTQNSHSHTERFTDTHTAAGGGSDLLGGTFSGGNSNQTGQQTTASTTATNQNTTATNQAATATNQSTGGDGAHNNVQPSTLTYFIVKT